MKWPVGAVVVAYRSTATINACLTSLKRNDVSTIVVVDNEPTRSCREIVQVSGAWYLPQSANYGFAAGANAGARKIAEPYILFLNPDAALENGAAAAAYTYLTNHPKVAVVGLLPISLDGRPEQYAFGAPVTPWTIITRKVWPTRILAVAQEVGWVSGVALLIRREVFGHVGGFDPGFFLYWEDVDLGRRVRQAGGKVMVLPQARVQHQRGASLADTDYRTTLYDTSADRYWRKHYPKSVWLLLVWVRKLYRSCFYLFR